MTALAVNAEHWNLWLNELRTTSEPQAREYLSAGVIRTADGWRNWEYEDEEQGEPAVDGYCCLGIAVNLMPESMFTVESKDRLLGHQSKGLPTIDFIRWLGLEDHIPAFEPIDDEHHPRYGATKWEGFDLILDIDPTTKTQGEKDTDGTASGSHVLVEVTASSLNDGWGLTFAQIADMLDHFGVSGVRGYA